MTLDQRRSEQQAIYAALAAKGGTYGSTNHGRNAYPLVMDLLSQVEPKRVIDFGCGRNDFCRRLRAWGISACGIDFAFPEADYREPMHATSCPAKWATVIVSFDALEHCLPEEVDEVIAEMRRVGKGPFVMSIGTRPSIARGVNGEDLHPTLKPVAWWLEKLGGGAKVVEHGYIVGDWSKE